MRRRVDELVINPQTAKALGLDVLPRCLRGPTRSARWKLVQCWLP